MAGGLTPLPPPTHSFYPSLPQPIDGVMSLVSVPKLLNTLDLSGRKSLLTWDWTFSPILSNLRKAAGIATDNR